MNTIKLIATTLISFAAGTMTSHGAIFQAKPLTFADSKIEATQIGFRLTPQETLKRVLRPHHNRYIITRKVRAAAGDPNMVVFDRRGGASNVWRCSFITHRGKRAMVCD